MTPEEQARVRKIIECFDVALFSENEAVKSALKELMMVTMLAEDGNKPVKRYLSDLSDSVTRLENRQNDLHREMDSLRRYASPYHSNDVWGNNPRMRDEYFKSIAGSDADRRLKHWSGDFFNDPSTKKNK